MQLQLIKVYTLTYICLLYDISIENIVYHKTFCIKGWRYIIFSDFIEFTQKFIKTFEWAGFIKRIVTSSKQRSQQYET